MCTPDVQVQRRLVSHSINSLIYSLEKGFFTKLEVRFAASKTQGSPGLHPASPIGLGLKGDGYMNSQVPMFS